MHMSFADLGLPREIVAPLAKSGITAPFPIQAATIPDALAGRDVCGMAPTGSGKTLAFGLPILARVAKAAPHRPHALILSPTRELAEQIRRELAPVAAGRGLRLLTVYGGVPYHPQRSKLRRGVDVLVACPGRLLDLLAEGDVSLDAVTHVVVDEADRMADMGFLPQVRQLLDATPRRRQTVLFSATLDGDVAELTRRYQHSPVRHDVTGPELDAGRARHHFWRVEHSARLGHVADVVSSFRSTLVFTRTRRGADRLAHQLARAGIHAGAIHGGRSQRQRDRALRDFTTGAIGALVATDVAARGIHVDGVDCVVHFDPPEDAKAYVHRSGRTARAGAGGHVVSLLLHDQVRANRKLRRELGIEEEPAEPSLDALRSGADDRRPGSHRPGGAPGTGSRTKRGQRAGRSQGRRPAQGAEQPDRRRSGTGGARSSGAASKRTSGSRAAGGTARRSGGSPQRNGRGSQASNTSRAGGRAGRTRRRG